MSPDVISFSFCNPFGLRLFSFSHWQVSILSQNDLCLPCNKEGDRWAPAIEQWNGGMAYFGEPHVEPLSSISKSSSPTRSHYASTLLQDRRSGTVFPVGSLSFPRHPRATTACGLQFRRICSLTFDCILINSRTSSSLPYNIAMPSCLMCLPPSVVGYWGNEPEHQLYCQTNTD